MPIITDWYREGRVIRIKTVGNITLEDALHAGRVAIQMLDNAQVDKVHLFLDDSELIQMDNVKLADLREFTMLRHPRVGWIVNWGSQNRLFSFLQTLVAHIAGLRWKKFNTEAEAVAFLDALTISSETENSAS